MWKTDEEGSCHIGGWTKMSVPVKRMGSVVVLGITLNEEGCGQGGGSLWGDSGMGDYPTNYWKVDMLFHASINYV